MRGGISSILYIFRVMTVLLIVFTKKSIFGLDSEMDNGMDSGLDSEWVAGWIAAGVARWMANLANSLISRYKNKLKLM